MRFFRLLTYYYYYEHRNEFLILIFSEYNLRNEFSLKSKRYWGKKILKTQKAFSNIFRFFFNFIFQIIYAINKNFLKKKWNLFFMLLLYYKYTRQKF